jgi:two-component system nitrogen regulation sensor histidine kinase NtrY
MPAPKFELADIGEIIRQAVFAEKITYSEIEYAVQIPPEEILVSMDARLMVQAMSNILKNAAESIAQAEVGTPSKPHIHKIEVSLNLEANSARIEINDSGIGFPLKDRNRLLEPYMTTRSKGTGLGLAIVARVMEEHGGSLALADRTDGQAGGSVIMILPIGEKDQINSQQGVVK